MPSHRSFRPASLAAFAVAVLAVVSAILESPQALAAEPASAAAQASAAAPAQATGQVAAAESAAGAARLLRTALIVQDVERSRRFYALFGYVPESEMGGAREPDKTAFPLNAAAKKWRLMILGSPANPTARIGLVSFDDPQPAASRPPRRKVGRGDLVFVFDVDDARQVHERLKAAGVDIVETPQVYLSKQLDAAGRPLEGRVFHVFDPDGNLVELLEPAKPVAR